MFLDELPKHIKMTAATAVIFKVDRYQNVSVYFSANSVRHADGPDMDSTFQSRQVPKCSKLCLSTAGKKRVNDALKPRCQFVFLSTYAAGYLDTEEVQTRTMM